MAFYIYLTTNLINGKQYIGQHKGELNDSYLGSGTNISKAINKYGKEKVCEALPRYFKKENRIKTLSGIPFPYWLATPYASGSTSFCFATARVKPTIIPKQKRIWQKRWQQRITKTLRPWRKGHSTLSADLLQQNVQGYRDSPMSGEKLV